MQANIGRNLNGKKMTEALNLLFKDLTERNIFFGEKIIEFSGDFRPIPPNRSYKRGLYS